MNQPNYDAVIHEMPAVSSERILYCPCQPITHFCPFEPPYIFRVCGEERVIEWQGYCDYCFELFRSGGDYTGLRPRLVSQMEQ